MAETQHDHRLAIEKEVVDSNVNSQKLGTVLGFIVAMTAISWWNFPCLRRKRDIWLGFHHNRIGWIGRCVCVW
jgi:hypothetical protein